MWTHTAVGWTIQALGTLPGDESSNAFDINDFGDVTGVSRDIETAVTHAFLWTAGTATMVELPGLGGGETYALRINNSSDVAGLSRDLSGNRHAVAGGPR